jgi:hypothetical protein
MYPNLKTSLDRADKLVLELQAAYEQSLNEKAVSDLAVQLTHEICSLLRGILDRVANRYWELKLRPNIPEKDRDGAKVYFPITKDQSGFDSTMGQWRWKLVRDQHQALFDYLLKLQPFQGQQNRWLHVLNDLAVQGKHIDLVPQIRVEEKRITVKNNAGTSVSWNPGATRFGSRVMIAGAPVDPNTQRIVPTAGVSEQLETWVGFTIKDHGDNALSFCRIACRDVRRIVSEMTSEFGLE